MKAAERFITIAVCALLLSLFSPVMAHAETDWPEGIEINAEGGIVMDADSGTILYEKNIHNLYYPASITKILTALIVLEECNMDEIVTFSYDAVHNVESGSTSAGLDTGDQLSVKDCLYALILKSANEVANALAEHVSGSIEAFAEKMNERAAELGCVDSHFANPSGLNDPDHYVSAYDMALICKAALQNEDFVKIDSALYYELPPTKYNPDGLTIYPGHKMLKKSLPEYYEGCFGGKTGYTLLAGNTLVTFATRDDMTLIVVILDGLQTHYADTKSLLDFGFNNFQTVSAREYDTTYIPVENDLSIAGLSTSELSSIQMDKDSKITFPRSGGLASITSQLSFDLDNNAPSDAIGQIDYYWGNRQIGTAYLGIETLEQVLKISQTDNNGLVDIELLTAMGADEAEIEEALAEADLQSSGYAPAGLRQVPVTVRITLIVLAILVLMILIVLLIQYRHEKKEEQDRMLRRKKRLSRMEDSGISAAQFDILMEQKRAANNSSSHPYQTTRRSWPFSRR